MISRVFNPSGQLNFFMRGLLSVSQNMPANWLGRRIAFIMRRIFRIFNANNPVDVEIWGARMKLHPSGNIAEKRILFTPNFFDPIERSYLQSAFRSNFVFFDIGANIGGYTLFVASKAPKDSVIVAIEPQPVIKERLAYNCEQNKYSNVILIDKALSDRKGKMSFSINKSNLGESALMQDLVQGDGYVDVDVEPLLEIVNRSGVSHIDAIKIDVEGAEEPILLAYFNSAPKALYPKLMIVENGRDRWKTDLVSFILDQGYRLTETTRLNFIFQRA